MVKSTRTAISAVIALVVLVAVVVVAALSGSMRTGANVEFIGNNTALVPPNSSVLLLVGRNTYARVGNIDGNRMYVNIGLRTTHIVLCGNDCSMNWSQGLLTFKFEAAANHKISVSWPPGFLPMRY